MVIIASFYIKERIDFKYRKIIFSSTGNYVHNLYAAVQRMGKAKNNKNYWIVLNMKSPRSLEQLRFISVQ